MRGVAALGVLAGVAVVALAATSTSARPLAGACGSAYWGLKTLSDPQRNLVNLQPRDTTLEAIARLARPSTTPTTRNTAFERQVWRVPAQITKYRLEADGDVHLVLFDAVAYGIAEMPDPGCVPKNARARTAITDVRQQFVSACGQPTHSWRPLGAVVKISGVGFWDKPNPQNPHAPNFTELHPVTELSIVAGCK